MLTQYYNEVYKLSNFDFLKDFDDTLYKLGNRIEKEVNIAPSAVKADATPFLEYLLNKLLNRVGMKFNYRKDFYTQLDTVHRKGIIDYNYKNKIYSAYMLRNKIHDSYEEMVKNEVVVALSIHEKLFNIAKKYYLDFNENADDFKGVPSYKPIELDTSDEEIDMVKIPDFSEVIDFKYDYCVICGEPNHSSYSLCCPKCSSVLENANNFISIRNYFGKDSTFTKENLIEYGIHEGYVNQLLTHLVRENMLNVTGRFYTFNNMYFDKYMTKIDNYLAVGELITKFREDKITPSEIKQTFEYREGSLQHEPFYEFYKIINHEIINKFERDILSTEDVWNSIEYTTITQKQLETWYMKNMNLHKKGKINESFLVFNSSLMGEYIDLKRQGLMEKDIKKRLNISTKVYEFWTSINDSFEDEIANIKQDLILKYLKEGKTKAEVLEIAGVTPHEYDNLYKVSDYNHDDYADEINREREARKLRFTSYLASLDIETSCRYAKISPDDFYNWYDNSKLNSQFYLDTTEILMGKYLDERKKGISKSESIKMIGLDEKYLNQWFTRSLDICKKFKNDDLKVTVALTLRGFKWDKSIDEICEMADINEDALKRFLRTGAKGSEMFGELFEYYENEMIPKKLDTFLKANETKSMRNALESAYLSEGELEKYYELGKSGDKRFEKFYNDFYNVKKGIYVYHIEKGKTHNIAMRESRLTSEEYEESKEDLEKLLRKIKFRIVLEAIANNKTSNVAARDANCSVDEIYEWYFKGRDGDEEYEKFYDLFHNGYVRPSAVPIQEKIDEGDTDIDNIIRSNKHLFTKKDIDIWLKNGIISVDVFHLEKNESKKEEMDDDEDKPNKNEVKKVKLNVHSKAKKSRTSLGKILDDEYDVEELKKQILKK